MVTLYQIDSNNTFFCSSFQCMEKCEWKCEHVKCSKLCHEPCDRELCERPDKKVIRKCGHPSIGVCGEKMPRLCRICDKDEVEEIFFGNEDEPDARFIQLEDCPHAIEIDGLMRWMKSESESNSEENSQNSIQFKKCPKCKTIIRHTKALNTFIQASLRDIQQVKLKVCGDPKVNRNTQHALFERVKNILDNETFSNDPLRVKHIYKSIEHETELKFKNQKPKPNQTLIELTNKLELVERLRMIFSAFEKRQKPQQNISNETIEKFNSRLRMAASFIATYKNCPQQREDILNEIMFLQSMCDVIVKASRQPFNDTGKRLLNEAFELANKYGTATETVREAFQAKVTEACKYSSGLGISTEEHQMILNVMSLNDRFGRWYKCSNGHIYAIGDCGRAMETSKCPECNEIIGGRHHGLVSSNALATEMDGAAPPDWPVYRADD